MTTVEAEAGSGRFPAARGAQLAFAVVASHVPFLTPGFGTDTDCWKFASAIREIATTGHYAASRSPGYPLMEFASAPFQALGAWAPNALSALAAGAVAWLSARLFARHGLRDAAWAGAAVVSIPAAFIAGTSSIDYLWALAFALAAWLDAAEGRAARAGLWLGLAASTRLTSLLFGPSLVLLLVQAGAGRPIGRLARFAAVALVVAVAWYTPGFLRYGFELFSFSEGGQGQASAWRLLAGPSRADSDLVPWPLVLGQATVLLWGVLGCAALAVAALASTWRARGQPTAGVLGRDARWPLVLLIGLEGLLYVRLPHDEGYLLPTVPFALLALASRLSVPRFRAVCAVLLLSPFLCGVDVEPPKKGATPATSPAIAWRWPVAGQTIVFEPFRGPVPRDHAKRLEQARLAEAVRAWWPRRPERFQIVAGGSYPMLYHFFPAPPRERPFVRTLSAAERTAAREAGVALFALPDGLRSMQAESGAKPEGITLLAGPVRSR